MKFKRIIPVFDYRNWSSRELPLRLTKMDAAIGSETTVLDLNDNCLLEVFEYLSTDHLIVVADVCNRFRQNAVAVRCARHKRNGFLIKICDRSLKKVYPRLRLFGASIDNICLDGVNCRNSQPNYLKRLVEHLIMYCVRGATQLWLRNFDITNEFAVLMAPLLGRSQRLRFESCHIYEESLENLLSGLWELRELFYVKCCLPYGGFKQKLPKLKRIQLWQSVNLRNRDIEEFLMGNAQLKNIDVGCKNGIDDTIFHSIAQYTPRVEKIIVCLAKPTNKNNIKYLSQLRELKSLTFGNPVSCTRN